IQTKPTVFPLQSCASDTSGGLVDIGCLATGYVPSRSVTFTWRDKGKGSDISDFVQYPEVQRNGAYSVFTQIKVKAEDWEKSNTYTCNANQGQTAESTDVTRMVVKTVNPTLYVMTPSQEELTEKKSASFACLAKGFSPKTHKLKWYLGSKEVTENVTSLPEVKDNGDSLFSASSFLSLPEKQWKSDEARVTCVFERKPGSIVQESVSFPPSVFILGPAEQAKQVTLTCYAKDFYPKEVLISWLASDEPLDRSRFSTTSLIQTGDTYSVYSQLTIEKDEWDEGKGYSCAVHHETNSKEIKAIVRAIDSLTKKSSSVNLSLSIPQTYKYPYIWLDPGWYVIEGESDNAGHTIFTFILLFLITLFYSIGATLTKVTVGTGCAAVTGRSDRHTHFNE
uniref:Ig-like domain-containing protein n=1 Tax=Paramormyrops kingsleyae TaxID=1676925 RepID=A0A3B3SSI4_9TELE